MSSTSCRGVPVNGTRVTVNGARGRTATGDRDANSCKIVILGCPGVGKTALTVRFMTKRFIGEYCPTLESIHRYHTDVDSDDVRLDILDTAGQVCDQWRDYYAYWGDTYIFVYSITDRASFEQIITYKRQVEAIRRASICGVLVGNKADLLHDRQVSASDAEELADEIGCKFYEVSAADWTQVTQIVALFHDAVREHRRLRLGRRKVSMSSSMRFKQAIQKVISGRASSKRSSTT